MVANARLATQSAGRSGRTVISQLHSEAPLLLRPTMPSSGEPWNIFSSDPVWVCLAAGAAGPVGGDRLTLSVEVGADSSLVLAEVSSTVLLPGPHGHQSRTTVDIHVADGATLIWLPKPMIAARGCHHHNDVRVDLEPAARLLIREELLLGRHGEACGAVQQSIRVRRDHTALYHQQFNVGPGAAWNTPAVGGDHRAVGSILVVDPDWADQPPPGGPLSDGVAVLTLAAAGAVVTALAADSLELRRGLTVGLTALTEHRSRSAESKEYP